MLLKNMVAVVVISMFSATLWAQPATVGEMEALPDGKGIKIAGKTEGIQIEELIRLTCELQNIKILYDPKKVKGQITVHASSSGFVIQKEAAFSFLQTALKQFRLILVPFGTDSESSVQLYEIIPAMEAITQSNDVIILGDIASWTDTSATFVTLVVNLKYADANSVRGALQNLTTRNGGQVNPIAGVNALIIADYSYNIRRLAKIVQMLDVPPIRPTLELIELSHADPKTLAEELNLLMAKRSQLSNSQQRRPGMPSDETIVAISPSSHGRGLMVSGHSAGIELIRGLVKKLDVEPATGNSNRGQLLHYHSVKNGDAADIAKAINDVLGNVIDSKKTEEKMDQRGRISSRSVVDVTKPRVSADSDTNSILIRATHAEFLEIKALIEKLDVAATESSSKKNDKSSGCAATHGQTGLLLSLLVMLFGVSCYRRRKLA